MNLEEVRDPHDPTSSRLVTPLKALSFSPWKPTRSFAENLFLTKFQACKQIPRRGRELNLLPDVSLARDVALNITARSVMKMKPADCNGNDLYKCFRYKNALATVQTSPQCADSMLIPGNVTAVSCALPSRTVEFEPTPEALYRSLRSFKDHVWISGIILSSRSYLFHVDLVC